jgi:hypothetical protein
VNLHVWIAPGSTISAIQPYVQQGSSGNWICTGNYQAIAPTVVFPAVSLLLRPSSCRRTRR